MASLPDQNVFLRRSFNVYDSHYLSIDYYAMTTLDLTIRTQYILFILKAQMRPGSSEELYCQEPLIFMNIKMSFYFPTKALDSQR